MASLTIMQRNQKILNAKKDFSSNAVKEKMEKKLANNKQRRVSRVEVGPDLTSTQQVSQPPIKQCNIDLMRELALEDDRQAEEEFQRQRGPPT